MPPNAKQPLRIVLPASSSPTATAVSANSYDARSRTLRYAERRACGASGMKSDAISSPGLRSCSMCGVLPGRRWKSVARTFRSPFGPRSVITPSSAAKATAKWVGCSTSAFIRSMRFVPPATKRAFDPIACAASFVRAKSNGCMLRLPDRGNDADVTAAAADVAAHPLADLVVGIRVPFAQQRDGGADLPRGAVAALETVIADEGGLHRIEAAAGGEAFDRDDRLILMHRRERDAGVDAPAVDEHGACATCALVAAFLRAREVEVLAQRVEER